MKDCRKLFNEWNDSYLPYGQNQQTHIFYSKVHPQLIVGIPQVYWKKKKKLKKKNCYELQFHS